MDECFCCTKQVDAWQLYDGKCSFKQCHECRAKNLDTTRCPQCKTEYTNTNNDSDRIKFLTSRLRRYAEITDAQHYRSHELEAIIDKQQYELKVCHDKINKQQLEIATHRVDLKICLDTINALKKLKIKPTITKK
jgi:hypothetical protein